MRTFLSTIFPQENSRSQSVLLGTMFGVLDDGTVPKWIISNWDENLMLHVVSFKWHLQYIHAKKVLRQHKPIEQQKCWDDKPLNLSSSNSSAQGTDWDLLCILLGHLKVFRMCFFWGGAGSNLPSKNVNWLVVSTHLKNISQNWKSSPNRGEHKKYLKPPPSKVSVGIADVISHSHSTVSFCWRTG